MRAPSNVMWYFMEDTVWITATKESRKRKLDVLLSTAHNYAQYFPLLITATIILSQALLIFVSMVCHLSILMLCGWSHRMGSGERACARHAAAKTCFVCSLMSGRLQGYRLIAHICIVATQEYDNYNTHRQRMAGSWVTDNYLTPR